MVVDEKIRKEIKDRVERMFLDKFNNLFEYIKVLELLGKEIDIRVFKYFGVWSDIDEDLFEEFIECFLEKRLQELKGNF